MHTQLIDKLIRECHSQLAHGELHVAKLLEEAANALEEVDYQEQKKINAIPALLRPKEKYGE